MYFKLLDLGCGPGIYAEKFHQSGYLVTGIDLSRRSVDHAKNQAAQQLLPIDYSCQNYLALSYENAFDIITLIYCDYGALSPEDRKQILATVYRALKPGGVFIVDVFAEHRFAGMAENRRYDYYPDGGFWHEKPHICLHASYLYEDSIVADQYVIVSNDSLNCYHIWVHHFSQAELADELTQAGFSDCRFYGDIAGKQETANSDTLCVTVRKQG